MKKIENSQNSLLNLEKSSIFEIGKPMKRDKMRTITNSSYDCYQTDGCDEGCAQDGGYCSTCCIAIHVRPGSVR